MKYLVLLLFFWGCQDNYYVNKEPEQVNIEKERLVIHTKSLGDCELTKIARFSIEARVLSKRSYLNDFDGELNPYDLAVGWKKMSSFEILNQLKIFHSSRFYYFQASEQPVGITFQEALEQSANIHLIPANEDILEQIEGISSNEIYFLSGYLVTSKCSNGFSRGTSITRNDSGNGACEQLYVEEIRLVY